jgi:hypothetical protein
MENYLQQGYIRDFEIKNHFESNTGNLVLCICRIASISVVKNVYPLVITRELLSGVL